MSLFDHSLSELQKMLENKEITVADLVDTSYKRIAEVEEKVQAFITLDEENARKKAAELDEELAAGNKKGLLFGIPAGIKDNIMTKDVRSTAASRMLEDFVPFYDAAVVEQLNDAQSVMIGKQNLDEFAMGSSTETSYFKQTKNPWNLEYVPGGSSGGSAAAVAAGEVLFSIGTDTGGSIRQPAAFCGIVGMKPTYGRVSRFGVAQYGASLDTVGPLTRKVEDNAFVLQAISGKDHRDPTSIKEVPDFLAALTGDVKGLKIAVPKQFLNEQLSEDVKESVQSALKVLEERGATWEEVDLPLLEYAQSTYYVLAAAEATTSMMRYDGIRYGYRSENAKTLDDVYTMSRGEGFGEEIKRRLIFGTHVLSAENFDAYYQKAQKIRTLIKQQVEQVFEAYDVIVGPTTTQHAFKLGENSQTEASYTGDFLTTPANLVGLPAISVPCGFSNGLPLGLQIIGKHFDEETVYRVAHTFEQATDFHKQKPTL